MFVQMPDTLFNVGIVGSLAAIERHAIALNRIQDIRITGQWITDGEQGSATDADTGITCMSPSQVTGNADAVIIAGGGAFCEQVAISALRSARHVFIYPNIIHSVAEATQLIKLAREANVILRAGKTGNDNIKSLLRALPDVTEINMIELQHDYQANGNHAGVRNMFDALLADIEVINSLVKARVISIKAKGLCMLASEADIVSARLEFDNGCAVNYNCNLVAAQNGFTGTLVLKNRILKYNFGSGELSSWFVQHRSATMGTPFFLENIHVEKTDSLTGELSDFIDLIRTGPAFLSMNDNGFEPYMITDRILEKVMKTLVRCS
jgi:predicted dehydrogenase